MPELNAIAALAGRDLLKFFRDPGRLVAAVVFPFLMIFLLGGTLQLNLGRSAGFNFIGFTFTGFLGMTLFQSTAQGLTSLMEDRLNDFAQEVFVSPVSRYSIVFGKIMGETLVAIMLVAVAPDWPGLERGARTGAAAIETLESYLPRYARVAKLAGMEAEFATLTGVEVVEQYGGTGSTDFWGISFAFSSIDWQPMSSQDLERQLTLAQACWTFFDSVRGRVSAQMRKGVRGGGRDRDRIVRHVLGVEQDWATKLGVRTPEDAVVTDDDGLKAYRHAYCAAIRTFHSEGKPARTWPLRFLIRHTAYHTMDHAWEMEDKDLTGAAVT